VPFCNLELDASRKNSQRSEIELMKKSGVKMLSIRFAMGRNHFRRFMFVAQIALLSCVCFSQSTHELVADYLNETQEEWDTRMSWWREARFGMFIHWGVYAVPAGHYEGRSLGVCWLLNSTKMPLAEYEKFAQAFNPQKYDPEFWAQLARRAGMKYMVLTARHHDGFALWPSEASNWNIRDATPYGEDLIGPLAQAARNEGLRFGLYYSHAKNWYHPGGIKSIPMGSEDGWDERQKGTYLTYWDTYGIPQLEEILSYKPDILWWDQPVGMTEEIGIELVKRTQQVPGIIQNDRLIGGFGGHYSTHEQNIPPRAHEGDFEICMTMNSQWGYKKNLNDWKSTKELIQILCEVASIGGNLLLNVGPDAQGCIPNESVKRLEEIGAWMEVNSESIYGTTASPFHILPWGKATMKEKDNGFNIYLHVFNWPNDGELFVPGLRNNPQSITLLSTGEIVSARQATRDYPGLLIEVPRQGPDPYVSVIKLELGGKPDVVPNYLKQAQDGSLKLKLSFCERDGFASDHIKMADYNGIPHIESWKKEESKLVWRIHIEQPGTFDLRGVLSAESEDKAMLVRVDQSGENLMPITPTGDYEEFAEQDLGNITISTTGDHVIEIRAHNNKGEQSWTNGFKIRELILIPISNSRNLLSNQFNH
jgi:alpha-L-fucosidase